MSISDTIGPTPERIRKHAREQVERPRIDRETVRPYTRLKSVFETLRDCGALSEEDFGIASRFELHCLKSAERGGMVPKYELTSKGGTPIGQLANVDPEDDASAANARMDPSERFAYHMASHARACAALGHSTLAHAMEYACLHQCGTEVIGRMFAAERNPVQAKTSGKTIIKMAVELLKMHYEDQQKDYRKRPPG